MSLRLRVIIPIALVSWATLVGIVFARRAPGDPPTSRSLAATIPANGLTGLALAFGDGDVDLRPSPDPASDIIDVSVTLATGAGDWWFRKKPAHLADAALVTEKDGSTLTLALRGGVLTGAEATWTITAPARFAARIDVERGKVTVVGLSGGLDISVDSGLRWRNGGIVVDVPGGPMKLRMGVGAIDARTRGATFGAVDVRSAVGDTRLFLDGHELPGSDEYGPGSHVLLNGDGPIKLSAHVSVGDATIRIR